MPLDAKALQRKAGPLPVWAWGALGVGALLLWLYLRRDRAGEPQSAVQLVTGGGGPEQSAYSAPQTVTPAASMLEPEVLYAITGRLADLESRSHQSELYFDRQLGVLEDKVSRTVAESTLGAPGQMAQPLPINVQVSTAPATPTPQKAVPVKQPAPSRYYTYRPGQAPKGRKGDEAPTGARLGFVKGKGYYVLS